MRIIHYTVILSLLCLYTSCKNNSTQTFNEVKEKIAANPDSALLLLHEFEEEYSQMDDERKACFGLLHFEVSYKEDENYDSNQYLKYSIQYFKNKNTDNKLAYCYYCMGRMYADTRQYKESINMLLQTIEACDPNDFELLGKTYTKLGLVSSYQFETEHSLKYYDKALKYFEELDHTEAIALINKNMGMMYMYIDDYPKATERYKNTINNTQDSTLIGDALKDIGFVYSLEEKYDSALYYLYQSIKYPYHSTNGTTRFYTIADVYFEMEQYDSARVYCNKVLEGHSDIYVDRGCLEILTKIDTKQGNQEAVLEHISKLKEVQDSIQTIETQSRIQDVEKIYELEKTTRKVQIHRIYLLSAITALIVLFALLIYWFIIKNRKQKANTESFKNTLAETQKENEQVKKELQQKQENLIEKLSNELQLTKAKYQEEWKKGDFAQRETILKKVYQEVLLYNLPNEFVGKMNKMLNNIPNKLTANYPNITQKEILWCCLHLLNISSNDMCLLMDYKPTGLYKFKQRLYKKWNFDNVKDFELMLQKLLFDL